MKVRVYGDTAVVIGRLTMKGRAWKGTDVSGDYAFTDTFVKARRKMAGGCRPGEPNRRVRR